MDRIDVKYLFKHHKELYFSSPPKVNARDDWYYFMHIPKAGGTSIRFMLYDQFHAAEVYPNMVDYYIKQKGSYIAKHEFIDDWELHFSPKKKLLIGHYGLFPLFNYESKRPRVFTFLRHPVDRLKSAINYHSQRGRRFYKMEMHEILEACKRVEVSRIKESLVFGHNNYDQDNISSLFDEIDVIGVLEYLPQSIELLNKRFDWNLNLNHHRNKPKKNVAFTADQMDTMHELCSSDIELYRKGRARFYDQCKIEQIEV